MVFKKGKKSKTDSKASSAADNSSKTKKPVSVAKKLGARQIIGIMAIALLIANLLLFSFRVISGLFFWIALVAIWVAALIAMKVIKEK